MVFVRFLRGVVPSIWVRKRWQRSAWKHESSVGREPAVCTGGAGGCGTVTDPGTRGLLQREPWFVSVAACLRGPNACPFCSQQRAPGKVLLDAVCNHLNLVEGDYFGLEFPDHKKITVGDVHEMLLFYHLFDLREGNNWDLSGPDGSVHQKKYPGSP